MKSFLLILVLCTALSCAWPVLQNTEEATEKDAQLVEKYLDSDYPQEEPIPASRSQFNNVSAEQRQQMQEYLGPKATSKLDLNTLDVIKRPRCGVSDLGAYGFSSAQWKWGHTDLTYRIINYTPDIDSADVRDIMKRATKMWSDVTPLTFEEKSENSADIMISFGSGVHSDDDSDCPFDGKLADLAHAFFPGSGIGGDIHFDEDETWTKDLTDSEGPSSGHKLRSINDGSKGINLFQVATHEFGHSLGLDHSDNQDAVMYRSYVQRDPTTFSLHQDDIDKIQALYGRPGDGPRLPRHQLTPRRIREEQISSNPCSKNLPLNAVITYKGKILFFSRWDIIQMDPRKRGIKIIRISRFWPLLKCGVDAAYEAEGNFYFFKGQKYWTFKKYTLEINSPDFIKNLGFQGSLKNIDAAVYLQETKTTLFFSGEDYWRYYPAKKFMSHPKKIAYHFPGIGNKVDAAFQFNGSLYLIRDNIQFEFDSKTYRLIGWKNANTWFGCQG